MTIPVPILASLIAAAAAVFIAVVGAWGSVNSRSGRVEAEIRASRERTDVQFAAAEERALARHNELLAEIRLFRYHGHDADGSIYFRVPE